jgi:preprotein translocase subunit SecG
MGMITTPRTYYDRNLQFDPYTYYPQESYNSYPAYGQEKEEDEEEKNMIILRIFFVILFIVGCILLSIICKPKSDEAASENSNTNTSTTTSTPSNNIETRNQHSNATPRNGTNTRGNNPPGNNLHTRNQPTQPTTTGARNGVGSRPTAARNVDPELEAIRKMSAADRKDFVTNILRHGIYKKTQRVQTTQNDKNMVLPPSTNSAPTETEGISITSIAVSSDRCAICLEYFAKDEVVCTSQNKDCPHFFHHDCIFEWLLTNEVCPCCRRNYLHIDSVRKLDDVFVDIELGGHDGMCSF